MKRSIVTATTGGIEFVHRRPVLIPRALSVAVLNLIVFVVSPWTILTICIPIFYLAVILLSTRDLIQEPHVLHRFDEWICRFSGPFATLLVVLSVSGVGWYFSSEQQHQTLHIPTPVWHVIAGFVFELGTLLSFTCLCVPPARLMRGAWIWKVVAAPILFINGGYLILLTMSIAFAEWHS